MSISEKMANVIMGGLLAVFGAAVAAGLVGAGINVHGRADPDGAVKAVEDFGLERVEVTGKGSFLTTPCHRGEFLYRTEFKAFTTSGEEVSGTVCQGAKFFGNSPSVRLDR